MTHRVLTAVEALQLGLTEEVRCVANAQRRAWHVADALIGSSGDDRRPRYSRGRVIGHAECRLVNGGEVKSSASDAMEVAVLGGIRWSYLRDMPPVQRGLRAIGLPSSAS